MKLFDLNRKIGVFWAVFAFASLLTVGRGSAFEIKNVEIDPTKTVAPGDSLEEALREIGDGTLILSNGVYELEKTLEITGSPTIKSASGNAALATIYSATGVALKISGSPTLANISVVSDGKLTLKPELTPPEKPKDWPSDCPLPYAPSVAEFVPERYKNDERVVAYCKAVENCIAAWDKEENRLTGKTDAAVLIVGGSATAFGCDFSASKIYSENQKTELGFCAVCVQGEASTPTFERCKFHRCETGVAVVDGANPKVENCATFDVNISVGVAHRGAGLFVDCDFRDGGISAGRSGAPTVKNCKIRDAKYVGVYVGRDGGGEFVDCEIFNAKRVGEESACGVLLRESAIPKFTSCKIHDCDGCGVVVGAKGGGEFNDCEIWACAEGGAATLFKGDPKFTSCKIRDSQRGGVISSFGGLGEFVDCEISDSGLSNVWIGNASAPKFKSCEIRDAKAIGVEAQDGGLGEFLDCEITGSAWRNVNLSGGANPKFTSCKIRYGKEGGVWSVAGGLGEFIDCEISKNVGYCVAVGGNATWIPADFDEIVAKAQAEAGGEPVPLPIFDSDPPKKEWEPYLKPGAPKFTSCKIGDVLPLPAPEPVAPVAVAEPVAPLAPEEDAAKEPELSFPNLPTLQWAGEKSMSVCVYLACFCNGDAAFIDCDIYGEADAGVFLEQDSGAKFNDCRIYGGLERGVWGRFHISGDGAKFTRCEIRQTKRAGVELAGGNATFRDCEIRDGDGVGVRVSSISSGTFVGNTISDNQGGAWDVDADAKNVVRTDNTPNK